MMFPGEFVSNPKDFTTLEGLVTNEFLSTDNHSFKFLTGVQSVYLIHTTNRNQREEHLVIGKADQSCHQSQKQWYHLLRDAVHQLKQYQQNRFHKSKTDKDPDGNPEEHYTTSTGVLFLPYLDPQIVDCFQDSYLATANGSHKDRKLAVYSSKLRGLRNRKPSESL